MKKHIGKSLFSGLLIMAVLIGLVHAVRAQSEQVLLSEKLIRLHVLANSDSEQDQNLKLKVRDVILEVVSGLTKEAENLRQVERILEANLAQLETAAACTLAREGSSYPVKVSLEDCRFPTKTYGLFALPAGSYRALRVVIGQGEGRNWWCVLFPPLCNAATSEEFIQTAKKAGLTPEEIRFMAKSGEKYVFKFRLAELFAYVRSIFS